jgi:hypothetical protein
MTSFTLKLRDRIAFISPVLFVIFFASVLVYVSLISSIQVRAVVFEGSPGGGASNVWQGLLNALIFVVPAVAFAFVIAYLVKKKRMNVLKVFFASAIFLTTTIIAFFFIMILEDLVWMNLAHILPYTGPMSSDLPTDSGFISLPTPDISLTGSVLFCGLLGFALSSIVLSQVMPREAKNQSLLLIAGLMGSFLSFILPWWTVVPMLLLLVIYDIYAVFKGPIRAIFEEQQADYEKGLDKAWKDTGDQKTKGSTGKKEVSGPAVYEIEVPNIPAPASTNQDAGKAQKVVSGQGAPLVQAEPHRGQLLKKLEGSGMLGDTDGSSDILTSMTYGTKTWELGIGDLVFYAMLGSHTLMVGADLISTFGILAPWIFFATTLVGICIGFVITIKLLDRNVILPGLPIPIIIGLAFMGLTYLGFVLFL